MPSQDPDREIARSHIDLDRRIRKRAHEIWQSRKHDSAGDNALDDWLQAEKEILGGASPAQTQSRATVIGDAHGPGRIDELGEG